MVSTPLKNMSSSVGMIIYSHLWWKVIQNSMVPNHQAVIKPTSGSVKPCDVTWRRSCSHVRIGAEALLPKTIHICRYTVYIYLYGSVCMVLSHCHLLQMELGQNLLYEKPYLGEWTSICKIHVPAILGFSRVARFRLATKWVPPARRDSTFLQVNLSGTCWKHEKVVPKSSKVKPF